MLSLAAAEHPHPPRPHGRGYGSGAAFCSCLREKVDGSASRLSRPGGAGPLLRSYLHTLGDDLAIDLHVELATCGGLGGEGGAAGADGVEDLAAVGIDDLDDRICGLEAVAPELAPGGGGLLAKDLNTVKSTDVGLWKNSMSLR